jgi:hypothetical protein
VIDTIAVFTYFEGHDNQETAMDLTTSFDILGLNTEADEAQVKRAYKAQVRRWHPDQFAEGSTTKLGAEEHLKQINIAYSRIKQHLANHRPDPTVAAATSPRRVHPHTARTSRPPGNTSKNRSWIDHLFDALNAVARNRTGKPPTTPAAEAHAKRPKTFEQILDEMAEGIIVPKLKRQSSNPATGTGRRASDYRGCRFGSGAVGAVGAAPSKGPVKPVSRVRGIGKSR